MVKFFRSKVKHSFTLIELSITIGILGLALVATGGVLISVVKSYQKQAALQRIERNGDYATRLISEKVRKAKAVEEGSTTINGHDVDYLLLRGSDALGVETVEYVGMYAPDILDCANSGTDGYIFNTPTLGQLDPITNIIDVENNKYKVTRVGTEGVNVTSFSTTLSDGIPTQVGVTIVVQSAKCAGVFTANTKQFTAFSTARGSY